MKPTALVILGLLGLFFVFIGARFLAGSETLPIGGAIGCKAICGLGLLFSQLFGQVVGQFVVGSIWVGLGIFVCGFAFRFSRK